jgi:DEAD/DEAH box helicase domain-containing protein
VHFGEVEVVRQVTSFTRRDPETGQSLGGEPLDLPPRALCTRAVWWTVSPGQRAGLRQSGVDLGGAAHAAEHTAIGLLPLFASCDRMDIGGVSADLHPATGRLTVFVYDGHEGGAGFAERGFARVQEWLEATREAIAACECEHGCPSCIQSPKCGSGNEPLSKDGAVILLERLLRRSRRTPGPGPAAAAARSGAPTVPEAGAPSAAPGTAEDTRSSTDSVTGATSGAGAPSSGTRSSILDAAEDP